MVYAVCFAIFPLDSLIHEGTFYFMMIKRATLYFYSKQGLYSLKNIFLPV